MSFHEGNGAHTDPSPRPVALAVIPENIPAELQARPQWVMWRYEWNPNKKRTDGSDLLGDWDKPPSNAHTGKHASSTNSKTWVSFTEALAAYHEGGWDGIGYVPTKEDNTAGWDLDDCRNPTTGELQPWAAAIITTLDTYAEASVSGEGTRMFGRGWKPGKGRKEPYEGGIVEVYGQGRYLTVTGHRIDSAPATVNERPEQMAAVFRQVFTAADERKAEGKKAGSTKGQRVNRIKVEWSVPDESLTDEDILNVIEYGKDPKLTELWNGSTTGHDGDDSRADAALIEKLAWWIGSIDETRLDRLFRRSGLYREKWNRQYYRRLTFDYLIGMMTDFRKPRGEDEAGDSKPTAHGIILDYLKERYRPLFRRGPAIYSEALRRDVKQTEVVGAGDIQVVDSLAGAANAPKNKNGQVVTNKLPSLYRDWAKVAWGTLIKDLPDEEHAAEVGAGAEAEFRAKVGAALLTLVTLGETFHKKDGTQIAQTERRTILHFCTKFAKAGQWASIRSYSCWCRMATAAGGGMRLQVALRAELFGQISFRPLAEMGQTRFTRLCENYAVGQADKATGRRAVVLDDAFLMSLLPDLNDTPELDEDRERSEDGQLILVIEFLKSADLDAICAQIHWDEPRATKRLAVLLAENQIVIDREDSHGKTFYRLPDPVKGGQCG